MLKNTTERIKAKSNSLQLALPAEEETPEEPPGLRQIPHTATTTNIATFNNSADHFVERNGIKFAGTHLIIDLWGVKNIDSPEVVESTLLNSIKACNATLLFIHLHVFTPNNGISGVAVLAESHISIHTWPERQYAALDIFMCGNSQPEKAIAILKAAFQPTSICINQQLRGALHD